ncbi:MAG: T9SS type A sorting domain-containing protein [Bacteroidota bacterium]
MRVAATLFCLLLLPPTLFAQTWTWTQTTGSHPVIADMRNGSALVYAAPKEDELSDWQTLPFPFDFGAETVNGYFISDNGYITFDSNASVSEPDNERGTVHDAIFGYWDDLHLEGGNPVWSNEVRTKTEGTAPNRTHVIMWISAVPKGQTFSRSNVSFAIVLYEQGGFDVVFVAGRTDGTLTGTVGAVNADGSITTLLPGSPRFPYPEVTADPTDDVRYIFNWSSVGTDAALSASLTESVVKVNTRVEIRGTIKNLGSNPLTAFSIFYSIEGSPEQEMQVSGMNLASSETWDFTHDIVWTPSEAGRLYTVAMRIELGDGLTDENPVNDTLSSTVFTILGVSSEKRVLVEEFTGAWCGWCPDGAVQIEKLLQTYPLAIPVAIHSGGTDAMILPEGDSLAQAFSPSYPTAMIDRMHFDGEAGVPISRTRDAWITRTGEQFSAYTPLSVSVSGICDPEAFGGYLDVTVEFSDYAPPADYRVHCWLVMETVKGSGSGWDQSNYFSGNASYPDHPFYSLPDPVTGYEHQHVPIQLLTGAWGVAGDIPDMPRAMATYSRRFHFEQTGITESSRLYAVAFVTRHGEDVLDRPVLNATSAAVRVTGIEQASPSHFSLNAVFPQPATESATAVLTLPRGESVHAAIYDLLGRQRLLLRDGMLAPGSHTLSFPTAGLENGVYLLRVQAGEETFTTPMIVLH